MEKEDIQGLERRIDACFNEIKDVRTATEQFEREILLKLSETETDVSDIRSLLAQIKWLVIGFLAAYGGQISGLFDAISKGPIQ